MAKWFNIFIDRGKNKILSLLSYLFFYFFLAIHLDWAIYFVRGFSNNGALNKNKVSVGIEQFCDLHLIARNGHWVGQVIDSQGTMHIAYHLVGYAFDTGDICP